METTFYNIHGDPIAYSENGIDVYLFDGKPVAYIDDTSIYSFDGKHLGWFIKGWVRDHHGFCVFFTQNASGGPMKSIKSIKPIKSFKMTKPVKNVKEQKPNKPIESLNWSPHSDQNFFIK